MHTNKIPIPSDFRKLLSCLVTKISVFPLIPLHFPPPFFFLSALCHCVALALPRVPDIELDNKLPLYNSNFCPTCLITYFFLLFFFFHRHLLIYVSIYQSSFPRLSHSVLSFSCYLFTFTLSSQSLIIQNEFQFCCGSLSLTNSSSSHLSSFVWLV